MGQYYCIFYKFSNFFIRKSQKLAESNVYQYYKDIYTLFLCHRNRIPFVIKGLSETLYSPPFIYFFVISIALNSCCCLNLLLYSVGIILKKILPCIIFLIEMYFVATRFNVVLCPLFGSKLGLAQVVYT